MLLGKRPRPPMRRTESLTELSPDLEVDVDEPQKPSDQETPLAITVNQQQTGDWLPEWRRSNNKNTAGAGMAPMVSPRPPRKSSSDFWAVETAPFLRSCGLCNRRLSLGRDIFMYRGEIAFCSLECRQQQMNHDERKEKCSLSSMKDSAPANSGTSEQSGTGETVAAA